MNSRVKMVCRGIIGAGVLMLLASLVYYLTRWNDLPDDPGIHFDGNGNFDVYASKFYGFYPHVVGGLISAVLAAAVHLAGKVNAGLKITEKGDRLFRAEAEKMDGSPKGAIHFVFLTAGNASAGAAGHG